MIGWESWVAAVVVVVVVVILVVMVTVVVVVGFLLIACCAHCICQFICGGQTKTLAAYSSPLMAIRTREQVDK